MKIKQAITPYSLSALIGFATLGWWLWILLFRLNPEKFDHHILMTLFPFLALIALACMVFLGRSRIASAITAFFAFALQAISAASLGLEAAIDCSSFWPAEPFGAQVWSFAISPILFWLTLHRTQSQNSAIAYLKGLSIALICLGFLPILWTISSTFRHIEGTAVRWFYMLFHQA